MSKNTNNPAPETQDDSPEEKARIAAMEDVQQKLQALKRTVEKGGQSAAAPAPKAETDPKADVPAAAEQKTTETSPADAVTEAAKVSAEPTPEKAVEAAGQEAMDALLASLETARKAHKNPDTPAAAQTAWNEVQEQLFGLNVNLFNAETLTAGIKDAAVETAQAKQDLALLAADFDNEIASVGAYFQRVDTTPLSPAITMVQDVLHSPALQPYMQKIEKYVTIETVVNFLLEQLLAMAESFEFLAPFIPNIRLNLQIEAFNREQEKKKPSERLYVTKKHKETWVDQFALWKEGKGKKPSIATIVQNPDDSDPKSVNVKGKGQASPDTSTEIQSTAENAPAPEEKKDEGQKRTPPEKEKSADAGPRLAESASEAAQQTPETYPLPKNTELIDNTEPLFMQIDSEKPPLPLQVKRENGTLRFRVGEKFYDLNSEQAKFVSSFTYGAKEGKVTTFTLGSVFGGTDVTLEEFTEVVRKLSASDSSSKIISVGKVMLTFSRVESASSPSS